MNVERMHGKPPNTILKPSIPKAIIQLSVICIRLHRLYPLSDCRYIFFSRLPRGKSPNLVLCTAPIQNDAYMISAEGMEQIFYTNCDIGINTSNFQGLLVMQELPFYY